MMRFDRSRRRHQLVTNCPRFQKLCVGYVLMAIPRGPRETRAPYKRWTPFLNRKRCSGLRYMLHRSRASVAEPFVPWPTRADQRASAVPTARPPTIRPGSEDRNARHRWIARRVPSARRPLDRWTRHVGQPYKRRRAIYRARGAVSLDTTAFAAIVAPR